MTEITRNEDITDYQRVIEFFEAMGLEYHEMDRDFDPHNPHLAKGIEIDKKYMNSYGVCALDFDSSGTFTGIEAE